MFAPQQYHPVLPFNLNFPMERAKASYEKSMIKEAIQEVLGPHLDSMDNFVGSKSGSGSGPRVSSGGDESSGNVNAVLGLVQDALNALNEARANQGDTSEEMEALQERLAELEKLKENLTKERSVNEATLALMLKAVQLVTDNGSDEERTATFEPLEKANPTFSKALITMDDKIASIELKLRKKTKDLESLQNAGDPARQGEIAGLHTQISKLNEEKTDLEETAKQLAAKTLEEKRKAKENFDNQLAEKQVELAAANARLEGLGKGETVTPLKEELRTAKEALESLKTEKEKVDKQLETGTQTYQELEKKYNGLTARKTALDTVVSDLKARVAELEKAQQAERPGSPTSSPPAKAVVSPGGNNDSSDDDGFEDAKDDPQTGSDQSVGKGEDGTESPASDTESGGGGAEGDKSTGGEEEEQGGEKGGKSSISDEEKQTLMSLVNGSSITATKLKKDVLDKLKTVGQGRGGKKIHNVESIVLAVEGKKEEDRVPTYVGTKEFDLSQTNVAAIYKTMNTEDLTPVEKARLVGVIAAKHGIDVNGDSKMMYKKESVYHGSFDLGKLFMWL